MRMFSFFNKRNLLQTLSKRHNFLRTERPLRNTQDVDELPDKSMEISGYLDSRRTYTKWFNPNTFDPRAPDYYETVRGEWQEDVTREDFGNSILVFIKSFNNSIGLYHMIIFSLHIGSLLIGITNRRYFMFSI